MKRLLITLIGFIMLAGVACADILTWQKADPFPDEANGGYTIRFWSTDGTDRTQAAPYVANIPGADTLEYNIDSLQLLYDKEYSFQVWAYNGATECDDGSNIVTYTKAFPSSYIPPVNDLPTHIQIINPGNVNIQIVNK